MSALCVVCGRPTPDGYACQGCGITRPSAQLAELAELTGPARDVAHGQTSRGSGGGNGKPGSRLPFDLGATARLDAVQGSLTTWARLTAEERGADLGRMQRPVDDPIVFAAHYLASNLGWWVHRLEVDEFLADVERCARVVRGLARGPAEQKYLGECRAVLAATAEPCPDGCSCTAGPRTGLSEACAGCFCLSACHREVATEAEGQICTGDVYGPRGGAVGRCRTCGAEVKQSEREAWLDGEVRAHAFSARDIADAHRVNVKTIRTWSARGQLKTYWRTEAGLVAPWTDIEIDAELTGRERQAREDQVVLELEARGPRLHYVGDVLDLAAADAARRAGDQAKRARRKERAETESDERMTA